MADPEIELPSSPEQIRLRNEAPGISESPEFPGISRRGSADPTSGTARNTDDELDEKSDSDETLESEGEEPGEIVWHYLTYATEIPHPTSICRTRDGQPPPEPPDLKKYTSPFDWPDTRKNLTIYIACFITALTAFSAGSYSPGVKQMTEEWHVSSVAAFVGITTFTSGFAVAPMILAPYSEIYGRRPVFIASGILFVICQLCTGLTQSYAGMLVVRFFTGIGGSTFSTMVGGVVSDIYHTEDRNTPMALFSGGALFGTGWGPLVCGFIAQNTSWRWIFYVQAMVNALAVALICATFKETRGSVLLSQKAHALNKYYTALESAGYPSLLVFPPPSSPSTSTSTKSPPPSSPQRIRWKTLDSEQRGSLLSLIRVSLFRPFRLLLTEPVVFFFSLWVAFSWAVLYLTLAAIPLVFQRNHGFSLQQANAVFAAMCIGAILATLLSIYQERIARRYGKLVATPEGRLYFACIESALMPIGLFMFGWTSAASVHWVAPAIAITIATIGIFSIYLSTFNYLADTYHRYASSALAAQSFCRNMLGGAFPLVTRQMYEALTFGGASSLLGGIGMVLTVVPWVLVFYGPRIRRRSKFASEIMNVHE